MTCTAARVGTLPVHAGWLASAQAPHGCPPSTWNCEGGDRLALRVGRRMRAAGVTMDLAPVLDLDGGPGPNARDPDGTRSFSPIEKTASAAGLAFAAGLQAAGVVPVVKHFPGLGGATGNTDLMAAAMLPWSSLQRNGLLPFAAAVRAGVPAVMVANASVPGADQPARQHLAGGDHRSAAQAAGVLRTGADRLAVGGRPSRCRLFRLVVPAAVEGADGASRSRSMNSPTSPPPPHSIPGHPFASATAAVKSSAVTTERPPIRVSSPHLHGLVSSGSAGAQQVEADVGDHRGEEPAHVVDAVGVRAAETQPGFLQGIVGVAHRSEHPVRHGPQAGPVLFEPLGQPLLVVHVTFPRLGVSSVVTDETRSM